MSQTSTAAVLHSFWASSCSWRVRAALRLKGVPYSERAVDIVRVQEQLTEQFRCINPAQKVPALQIDYACADGVVLMESMAILQYLEDTRPAPPLQPADPLLRSRVREICETIVSGIQPLQNPGLRPRFAKEEQYDQFSRWHLNRGLQTLEVLLARSSEDYCVGSALTFADLCFVPQVYNAVSRKVDISQYNTVDRLYSRLSQHEIFVETHPLNVKRKREKLA